MLTSWPKKSVKVVDALKNVNKCHKCRKIANEEKLEVLSSISSSVSLDLIGNCKTWSLTGMKSTTNKICYVFV